MLSHLQAVGCSSITVKVEIEIEIVTVAARAEWVDTCESLNATNTHTLTGTHGCRHVGIGAGKDSVTV